MRPAADLACPHDILQLRTPRCHARRLKARQSALRDIQPFSDGRITSARAVRLGLRSRAMLLVWSGRDDAVQADGLSADGRFQMTQEL